MRYGMYQRAWSGFLSSFGGLAAERAAPAVGSMAQMAAVAATQEACSKSAQMNLSFSSLAGAEQPQVDSISSMEEAELMQDISGEKQIILVAMVEDYVGSFEPLFHRPML